MHYIASAVSRASLQGIANRIREIVGYENKPDFPIVEFMEFVMPKLIPGFNYEIVDDSHMENVEGLTSRNLIRLPNTVYNAAAEDKGRARFTVAHEVAHCILIEDGNIVLARSGSRIPAYRDPEWQANTLASEILIVPRLSVGMSVEDIMRSFKVSKRAATIHLEQKRKQGLP